MFEINFPKGYILFQTGQVNNNVYLITEEITRTYVHLEEAKATNSKTAHFMPMPIYQLSQEILWS
jgi:hypothetical protein